MKPRLPRSLLEIIEHMQKMSIRQQLVENLSKSDVRHHIQSLAPTTFHIPPPSRLEQDTQLQDWQRNAEYLKAECGILQYMERRIQRVVI